MPHRTLPAGLALIIALLAPAAANAAGALEHILKDGVVRIAIPDNFSPFGTLGPDMKPQGYDVDMAVLLAEGLGVKPELVTVASSERIPQLAGHKVDLVVSTLGKDDEREKLIDFSIAYAPFFSAVFGPASLSVAKPDDLAGKTIAVTRDTVEDGVLTRLAPAGAVIKRYDDNARTQVAFLSNQAELIATGNAVAGDVLTQSLVKKTVLKFVLRNSPCFVGVAKDEPDLLAKVNGIIAAARHDGRLDRISRQWLKAPLGDPEHPDLVAGK
ncbi:MAG TPA: transporter substrate-binding domain-containing protein [Stellaceae bacterium]|nr:transporter substrate-binding domain-containing protein [Stellaceae bacterium]